MHFADLPAQHAGAHRIVFLEIGDFEQRFGHATSATSSARQQAARWPPPQSMSGGYSASQRLIASLQRGANAQPLGSPTSDGTVPGISFNRAGAATPGAGTAGIEAINPRV